MYKCCKCGGCHNTDNIYLVPHRNIKEIVVLTDKELTVAVAQMQSNVNLFNDYATKIIYSSFIQQENNHLHDILGGSEGSHKWVNDLVLDNVFEVVNYCPNKKLIDSFRVESGDVINPNAKYIKLVKAEYDGIVYVIKIENTIVYFYMADKKLSHESNFEHAQSSVLYEAMGIAIYPQINTANSGPTCEVCKGCGGCIPCLACLACGEINFFSGVLSTISLSATISAANTTSTFSNINNK